MNINSLRSISIPEFTDHDDSLDHFYIKCCDKIQKETGEDPTALRKFIQIICCFPHSNSFLEHGFSDTKRIIEGRFSLSTDTLKAIKTVLDWLRNKGGVTNVKVSVPMIEAAKLAHSNLQEAERKREREEYLSRAKKRREEEEREKKRKYEEDSMSWDRKRKERKEEVDSLKRQRQIQDVNLEEALNMATDAKSVTERNAALESAKIIRKNLSEIAETLKR